MRWRIEKGGRFIAAALIISVLLNVVFIVLAFFPHAFFGNTIVKRYPIPSPLPQLERLYKKLPALEKKALIQKVTAEYGGGLPAHWNDSAYEKYGPAVGGYLLQNNEYVVREKQFDVDGDHSPELILEVSVWGGNHPPQEALIFKNNDTLILSASLGGAGSSLEPAEDGNGFYLIRENWDTAGACCATSTRRYRIIYEHNGYKPLWMEE
ncbi:MAG: hypothetical protein Q7S86_00505 [bacterium]|nr:hypothetical protein [bacterium]